MEDVFLFALSLPPKFLVGTKLCVSLEPLLNGCGDLPVKWLALFWNSVRFSASLICSALTWL